MEFTEFDLGARCHHCKRHDYLPLRCQSCGENFCQKHFHVDVHNCNCVESISHKSDGAGDVSLAQSAEITPQSSSTTGGNKRKLGKKKTTLHKCKKKGCKRRDMIPFTCKCCTKSFCSSHRLPKHHNCPLHLEKIAGQDLQKKHAAMLISDEAKKLAKLIQAVRA